MLHFCSVIFCDFVICLHYLTFQNLVLINHLCDILFVVYSNHVHILFTSDFLCLPVIHLHAQLIHKGCK